MFRGFFWGAIPVCETHHFVGIPSHGGEWSQVASTNSLTRKIGTSKFNQKSVVSITWVYLHLIPAKQSKSYHNVVHHISAIILKQIMEWFMKSLLPCNSANVTFLGWWKRDPFKRFSGFLQRLRDQKVMGSEESPGSHDFSSDKNTLSFLCWNAHLANGPWKKSLNSIFPTKYGIPKSLKG